MNIALKVYCFLLVAVPVYPAAILNSSAVIQTGANFSSKATLLNIDGCRFQTKGDVRVWNAFCLESNMIDRVPSAPTRLASAVFSITIKNQPNLTILRRIEMEKYRRLRKFSLTDSGLIWIEQKTFFRNRDLELVDLRRNALNTVDWRSVVGLAKASLDLRQNPLVCNCTIFWLAAWKKRIAKNKDIVTPDGSIFHLSASYLMALPADITDLDELECAGSSSNSNEKIRISSWAHLDKGGHLNSNSECDLPDVTMNPNRISTVEGASKSIEFSCEIKSAQPLDADFQDMVQLRIVDASETRSSVKLERTWREGDMILNLSTENVTKGLMGWYMCMAVSESGPQFDMASVVVNSKPQIRLAASELTTSGVGQLIEKFDFIIISYPPATEYIWFKNNRSFDIQDETNAAVFTISREDSSSSKRVAFFYGERFSLIVQLIFTYEFYQGDYSLRVCNAFGCDEMTFASYRNASWFNRHHQPGVVGIGPIIVDGSAPESMPTVSSSRPDILWIVAVACTSCGLLICTVGFLSRWIRRRRSKSNNGTFNGRPRGLERDKRSLPLSTYNSNSLYEPLLSTSVPVVPMASLDIAETLGEGAFGEVYLAYCHLSSSSSSKGENEENESPPTAVAAKRLKQIDSPDCNQDFVREAELMAKLDHANVVKFYGVCLRGTAELFLLYEYMDLGDLKRFLAIHGPQPELMNAPSDTWRLTPWQQMDIARQAASGLAYLHQRHSVHRDMASRNCLVKSPLTVKLSDFGLSRDIYFSDYYRLTHKAQLPVRWLPPESLCYGRFSHMSDVWSYGVVVWEIASFGEQPWRGYSNVEVMQKVGSGEVLTPPEQCHPVLRKIMLDCWKRIPCERVKLSDVIDRLAAALGQSV